MSVEMDWNDLEGEVQNLIGLEWFMGRDILTFQLILCDFIFCVK